MSKSKIEIIYLLLFTTILVQPSFAKNNSKITAFGLSDKPFVATASQDTNIHICYLDIYDKAMSQLQTTVLSQCKDKLRKISDSFMCRYLAKLNGITKLPAVLFLFINSNNKYVIYGESNLNWVLEDYKNYREQNNEIN